MTQQSNGVGVRFLCRDDVWEAFIRGTKPNFQYFGAPKIRWFFNYFGIDGPLLNTWDKTTINTPSSGVNDWGLWCCLAKEGENERHGIVFSHRSGTSIPSSNNIGSVDPILHNSGNNTLTQQSTDNGERFLAVYDDDGSIRQPTTWELFIFSSKIS